MTTLAEFFSLPMGALGPDRDRQVAVDEFGRPVYETQRGERYVMTEAPRPRLNALASVNALRDNPLGFGVNALQALAEGAWNAVEAPGNALRGQTMTYGDVADMAGVAQLGGAAMPAPRGALRSGAMRMADDAAETPAQQVARLLREGRASEVTDDLMARVDPQEMYRLYEAGDTGMPMPMDVRSRMQRAEEMGFPALGPDFYHGTAVDGFADNIDIHAFDRSRIGDRWNADTEGFSITSSPQDANYYTRPYFHDREAEGAVYPLVDRTENYYDVPMGSLDGTISRWDGREDTFDDWLRGTNYGGARLVDVGNNVEMRVVRDPSNLRSRFARFDPRLSHLANLSAGAAGAGIALPYLTDDRETGLNALRAYLEGLQ